MSVVLEVEDIKKIRSVQENLDAEIRRKMDISSEAWKTYMGDLHLIALQQEVREVVNECHDLWKYWKVKPVDKQKIIEESIDVIHFTMLIANKQESPSNLLKKCMEYGAGEGIDDTNRAKLIIEFMYTKDFFRVIEILFNLLNHYGFNRDDIIREYEKKNKINHERIESGY